MTVNRKPILILSEEMDLHGMAVRWALKRLGADVQWWQRSHFPSNDQITLGLSQDSRFCKSTISDISIERDLYRAIWNRRGAKPTISESIHRSDRHLAFREAAFLISGLLECILENNSNALIINSPSARIRADHKSLQLYLARKAGLKIPRTLISNSAQEVRNFFELVNEKLVAKSQIPAVWTDSDGTHRWLFASLVSKDDLSDSEAISAAPMIYQEKLDIAFEVRAVVFGHNIFSIKRSPIDRTRVQSQAIDIKCFDVNSDIYHLNQELETKIFQVIDLLGLRFAAVDIAVDQSGDHYFLEINESGQFIFLESEVPEVPILDAFSKFLMSGKPTFKYDHSRRDVQFKDFMLTESGVEFLRIYEEGLAAGKVMNPFELRE